MFLGILNIVSAQCTLSPRSSNGLVFGSVSGQIRFSIEGSECRCRSGVYGFRVQVLAASLLLSFAATEKKASCGSSNASSNRCRVKLEVCAKILEAYC